MIDRGLEPFPDLQSLSKELSNYYEKHDQLTDETQSRVVFRSSLKSQMVALSLCIVAFRTFGVAVLRFL